jgi:hypothetical protein
MRVASEMGGCVNRRIGERRLKPRFEVVGGELWGRVETVTSLVIRNIGIHGALLRGGVALPAGSTQLLTADLDGRPEQLRIRVTRCQPAADAPGGFDIGIEFLNLSAHMRSFVESCVAAGGPHGAAT